MASLTCLIRCLTRPGMNNIVLHKGTNDAREPRSKDLLDKYRKLIQQDKTKSSRKIMIPGVPARIAADNGFYSKAFNLESLENLCQQQGVEFVTMWDDFYNKADILKEDG